MVFLYFYHQYFIFFDCIFVLFFNFQFSKSKMHKVHMTMSHNKIFTIDLKIVLLLLMHNRTKFSALCKTTYFVSGRQ